MNKFLNAWPFLVLAFISCGNYRPKEKPLPPRVTFTEHIAPILYEKCAVCHRQDGGAHFSLINFADARKYAEGMAFVTKERLMPPWPADPDYTHFKDEKILSPYEIQLFEKWVKDGKTEGPAERMPKLPNYPEGSLAGKPDLRILVTPTFLKANSPDKFLLTKVPYSFDQVKWVSLIEFIPGKNKIVHHVNGDMVKYEPGKKSDVLGGKFCVEMREDTAGIVAAFKQMELPNDDGSFPVLQKSVVNYLPGAIGQIYPPGIGGYILPKKGAFLLNDIHYGFTGKDDIIDSSYINIFFSKLPPSRPLQEFQLGTLGASPVEPDMLIQPDSIKFVYSKLKINKDISVLTINPHMHLLGKSFKAYALSPDGDTIRLISIPRWDFNWQYFYTFKKMVKIPANSIIIAEGIYDNTRQNLNNPFTPPQLITDQAGSMKATDEMFQFIVSYIPYKPGDENISLE